jgi:hypothetical protein
MGDMDGTSDGVCDFYLVEGLAPIEEGGRQLAWQRARGIRRESDAVAWRVAHLRGKLSRSVGLDGTAGRFVRDVAVYTERLMAAQVAGVMNADAGVFSRAGGPGIIKRSEA